MEVLSISLESCECDTSGDELEDEEELLGLTVETLVDDGNPLTKTFEAWRRPVVSKEWDLSLVSRKMPMYLLSCDSVACTETNPLSNYYESVRLSSREIKPVMRLFGIDENGGTVLCLAHGFTQYFYAVPSNEFDYEDIDQFQQCLNLAVLHEMSRDLEAVSLLKYFSENQPPVIEVELLHETSNLNIFGYHRSKADGCTKVILKIHCWLSRIVWLAAKVLKNGVISFPFADDPCSYDVYEDTLNPSLRFLTSLNISCCSWIELDLIPGKWYDRDAKIDIVLERQSYCQTELDVHYVCIKAPETMKNNMVVPNLRVLSFDIECMTRPPNYKFPQRGNDKVLQIGNVLSIFDNQNSISTQPLKVVFMLGTCDPIPDAHVFSFNTEEDMLRAWRKFINITDPDVITGYNICKFDIPFLLDRAQILRAKTLPYFSRIIKTPASYRKIENESKRINRFADTISSNPGRIVFDMLPVVRQLFPHQQSFKLGDVSKQLLGNEEKDDVHYKDIFKLQNMSPTSRNKLARYCIQDAWLASKLIFRNSCDIDNEDSNQNILSYFCEMSRCSGSPLKYLVTKSSEYQQYFKTVRKQKNPGVIFPRVTPYASAKKRQREDNHKRLDKVRRSLFSDESSQQNSGTVIETIK